MDSIFTTTSIIGARSLTFGFGMAGRDGSVWSLTAAAGTAGCTQPRAQAYKVHGAANAANVWPSSSTDCSPG